MSIHDDGMKAGPANAAAALGNAGEIILTLDDLNISFRTMGGVFEVVKGVGLFLKRGEILAIVGESGSGKSVTSRAILGLHPRTARISGSIKLLGEELVGLDEESFNKLRGTRASMVFQEPSRALNPVFTIGSQMIDAIRAHKHVSRDEARERAIELLRIVDIPEPQERVNFYPHQLSGGQKQRVMIAIALSCDPQIIIADEPTTALDVTVQAEILSLLHDLRDRFGTSIIIITHNMGVVADIADRVVVMNDGHVVETADTFELFAAPKDEYTRRLLAAVPKMNTSEGTAPPSLPAVLELEDVSVRFARGFGRGHFLAVDKIGLTLNERETLAVVGESGSGKSTLARAVAGLQKPNEGTVLLRGVDLYAAGRRDIRRVRRGLGYIFQDPNGSLNPHHQVAYSIGAPLLREGTYEAKDVSARIDDLLDAVRLPRSVRAKYPHELSGGQTQRVSIARALIRRPALLIADEPTSALDVSVQDQVLRLLKELQRELGFACLFITHDLAVASSFADRAIVMRRGRIVEQGPSGLVFGAPRESYTKELIASVPIADPVAQRAGRSRLAAGM